MTSLVIFSILLLLIVVLYLYSAKGIISLVKFQERKEKEIVKIEPVLSVKNKKTKRKPKVE